MLNLSSHFSSHIRFVSKAKYLFIFPQDFINMWCYIFLKINNNYDILNLHMSYNAFYSPYRDVSIYRLNTVGL